MTEIEYLNKRILSMGMTKQFQEVEKYYAEKIVLIQSGKNYLSFDNSNRILRKLNIGKHSKGNKNTSGVTKIEHLLAPKLVTNIIEHGYGVVVLKQLKYGKDIVRQIHGVIEAIEEVGACDLTNIYVRTEEKIRATPECLIYGKKVIKESSGHINLKNNITNYKFCKEILKNYIVFILSNNQYYTFESDAISISVQMNITIVDSTLKFGKNEFEKNIESILSHSGKVAVVTYETLKDGFHRKIELIDAIHDISYMFPNREIKVPLIEKKKRPEIAINEELEIINRDTILVSDIEEDINNNKEYNKMTPSELAKNISQINLENYFTEYPINSTELIELVDFIDNKLLIESSIKYWNIEILELCIEKVELELYNELVGLTIEEVVYLSKKYNISSFVDRHAEFWDIDYIINNYRYIDIIGYFKKYPITREIVLKISEKYNVIRLLKAFPKMIDQSFLEKYPSSFSIKELIKSEYLYDLHFLEVHNYDINIYLEQVKLVDGYIEYIISIDPTKKYRGRLAMNSYCTQDIKARHQEYFFDNIFISRQNEIKPVESYEKYIKSIYNIENRETHNKIVEVRNKEKAEENKRILKAIVKKNGYY